VDLDLTEDQDLLRETSARFIQSACPLTRVRGLGDDRADPGGNYRRRAAELGWFALLVPEEFGGGNVSVNGVLDAAIIAEERGRLLQPTAFVATDAVVSGLAMDGSPHQQAKLLPAIASGEATATWALADATGLLQSERGVQAHVHGAGFVLSGKSGLVQDADRSDWLLVTASSDAGPAQFVLPAGTPGLSVRRLDGLDLTRSFCEVSFDDVDLAGSALVGEFGQANAAIERQLQVAAVLTVAESVGAMSYDFELAVEYAKTRIAFGRPIGSFQAVKHLLADTSLLVETSKAMSVAAARAVGSNSPDAGEVASMAKAFVGDSGIDVAQNCLQVFGGIGYTWDHDQHLYLRRLTTDAALYGDPTWHRERICQLHDL